MGEDVLMKLFIEGKIKNWILIPVCLLMFASIICLVFFGMKKIHVDISSSGYYDISPEKKYIVDVACVTKKRGGQLIDKHYEIKAMIGSDYSKAKAFYSKNVKDHEAGPNVDLKRDNVKWILNQNKVIVKVGNTNLSIRLDSDRAL